MSDFLPTDIRQFDVRAYERLAELLPRLLAEETRDSLLQAIADVIEELIPCSVLVLSEIRPEDGALVPIVDRGMPSGRPDPSVPAEESLEALAMAAARAIDADSSTGKALLVDGGIEATAAAPLVVRGRPIGCLTIRRRGPGRLLSDEELRFFARLADVAAITLDNARARALLEDLAHTDALTGLLNRRGFFAALERTLAQAQRDQVETSVVTVDVDDLKRINDRFGHLVGDEALKCIATTLDGRTRKGDIVGRLGGDEFAVVLPRVSEAAAAEIRVELQEILQHACLETADGQIEVTASFGIASTGHRELTAQKLVSLSDIDMYDSKKRRRLQSAPST